jgi:SulP family sulfate permease
MIAGVMLIAMGVFRLGTVNKIIPYPVDVGFTSGIALTIFASQVKDLLGLQIDKVPADFIHKWVVYGQHIASINPWAVGVGILSVFIIVITPRFSKKIPGSLIAIILVTAIAYVLRQYFGIESIETIGDRFTIDPSLPTAETPVINFEAIRMLLPTAFTIAMLGAIESLLSATVADGVVGDRHNSNTELIAQGIANVVTPIYGGIPATGAIARTMTNINNGGRTPVAGIVHAVTLLLIMLFLGTLTKHIPMACLAGVLVIVAYNMSEWRSFKSLLGASKSEMSVLLTTFLLTVIFDLTIAIEVGLLLAILLFLRRMSDSTTIAIFKNKIGHAEYIEGSVDSEALELPDKVEVYEIEGPFFFGVANKFEEVMKTIGDKPNVRIIRMRKVPFMDATGVHNLETLIKSSQKEGIKVFLSGVNKKVRKSLEHAQIDVLIGTDAVCANIDEAVEKTKNYLERG